MLIENDVEKFNKYCEILSQIDLKEAEPNYKSCIEKIAAFKLSEIENPLDIVLELKNTNFV